MIKFSIFSRTQPKNQHSWGKKNTSTACRFFPSLDSDDSGEHADSGQSGDYGESSGSDEFGGSCKYSDSGETVDSVETVARFQ